MPKTLQFRRGTTSELSSITGAPGELFVDTTKDVVVVSDGVTAGGFPLQAELVSNVNIKTINGTSVLGSGDITVTAAPGGNPGAVQYNDGGSIGGSDAFTFNGTDVLLTGNLQAPAIKSSAQLSLNPDNGNLVIEGINGNTLVQIKRGSNSGGNATISIDGSVGRIFASNGSNPSYGVTITGQNATIATTGPLLVGEFTGTESAGLPGQVLTSNGEGNAMSWTDAGGGGNVDLSEITQDVTPLFSEVYDIGSADKRWYDVYVSNKVDINGAEITGSEAGVVVDALLVDKLLFTDNIITPDNSTALEYEGDKGVLIINGNLDVEGDWLQVPVVADTPEDPILTTGEAGMLRYNQDSAQFEGYTTEWAALGGGGAIEEVGTCSLSSVGIGGGTAGISNNFFGRAAGLFASGNYNNAIGAFAGVTTSGCHNNFFGTNAGNSSQSGSHNNFFGCSAGNNNNTGCYNNFFGRAAGLGNATGCYNNFFGAYSGRCNIGGSANNFFGFSAGRLNTTGSDNNFFGRSAGNNNNTGCYNNFFGRGAGQQNTTGSDNNFFGRAAGLCNTTGGNNNFFGANAGLCNTIGCNNTFFGACSGRNNTSGSNNTFFGCSAGRYNTSGNDNNFFGSYSGHCNTSGGDNNFFGNGAGQQNTTGRDNNFFGRAAGIFNTTGSYNNFFGGSSGFFNTTGCNNNFFGISAGRANTSGGNNNFFGVSAGRYNTTGNYNNFFGANAGRNNTTGSNNLFFGRYAGTTIPGNGLANITTESNRIIMGNADHTCAQIQIAWTTVSDARDKCIYGAINRGLGFLKNVNPIEFAFKDRVTGELKDPAGKRRYGFSAQDILALEGDTPVIVSTENPDQLQMTNDYLIPILVNAVKELSAQVEELKSRLDQQTQ